MVNLETADKALKSVYLGVVAEQLNTASNPLLTKIEQTTSDVWGKEIIKLVTYGINGGIGAGDETGDLPMAAGNNYAQFKLELKNLYGSIEISDKAIRASENSVGAFVNLLNAEMEGLLKASRYNLGRMLYGDGSGKLATVAKATTAAGNTFSVNKANSLADGMVIDIYDKDGAQKVSKARIISHTDNGSSIVVDKEVPVLTATDYLTVQNSVGHELTGLEAIFGTGSLYGVDRTNNSWLMPYSKKLTAAFETSDILDAVDHLDEVSGSDINFITCSYDAKKAYVNTLLINRLNIDYMNLDGGFRALSFNGIPVYADRFIDKGTMYLLNTDDFRMHQLCDWRWLEGDGGKVIKQKAGTPTYTATLVKYADIICNKPCGQAKITGIH